MTIVYNQKPGGVMWSVPNDTEDAEREYNGRIIKRDENHSRYWLVDGMRFTGFKSAIDWIDQQAISIDD